MKKQKKLTIRANTVRILTAEELAKAVGAETAKETKTTSGGSY